MSLKQVVWIGSSRLDLMSFPREVQREVGHQISNVQHGEDPDDWKPFPSVGMGAQEIRVRIDGNQFRSIYVARFDEAVYVLHCFAKKTQRISTRDVEIARQRYRLMAKMRMSK
jgi:phage-related protein